MHKIQKFRCADIIKSANHILFGMSLADATNIAQEVTYKRFYQNKTTINIIVIRVLFSSIYI